MPFCDRSWRWSDDELDQAIASLALLGLFHARDVRRVAETLTGDARRGQGLLGALFRSNRIVIVHRMEIGKRSEFTYQVTTTMPLAATRCPTCGHPVDTRSTS